MVKTVTACSASGSDEAAQPNLSLVEIQRYTDQVHVQGYHLRSDCGLVLRTQSIFQAGVDEDAEDRKRN